MLSGALVSPAAGCSLGAAGDSSSAAGVLVQHYCLSID
jgi:hypothetical protein